MNSYIALNKESFSEGDRSIVPIRMEDRYLIMKWRNEQIFHLRQSKPLTNNDQDHYFNTTVAKLFGKEQPDQLLFSYLENGKCIGYGGLVHMNWTDKNAEISFITDTAIQNEAYAFHMCTFLTLITKVAFEEISFHKLFTYAFDVRPYIYPILEQSGFKREAVLKEHCLFNGEFKDVIIHTKYNTDNNL
ncbi:GNAT family N-acetyltransferase [Maribacter sp. CXY002]|uniref:GNAT family N-acetyltransferase n=1 Tax=Maribacter luteocoastalis TaxID=3407671 RepID=UPI003B6728DE